MKRVAILSWPLGGNTRLVADKLIRQFTFYNEEDIKAEKLDFLSVSEGKLRPFDVIIIGGSTVETEDNWLKADETTKWSTFFDIIRFADLTGKKAAVFAIGNQKAYPDNFADGMSELKTVLEQKGAKIIGHWPTDDYDFFDSRSIEGEKFIGLVIDQENQPELTDRRIIDWVDQLVVEIGN
ncbi:MAG: flavodoxin domain-containing protein [Bacteroidales bacterium]|jgi:flavodoxin I|nr:flavodoxin domain-containing protein [Bacteroidales bacterium]